MYYYLGPFVREHSDEFGTLHRAPDGAVGLIDLRGADQPFGLFVMPEPLRDSAYIALSDGSDLRDYHLTSTQRSAWRWALGLKPKDIHNTVADTLYDALVWTMERCGDPDGVKRLKPLACTQDGYLDIHLQNHGRISRRKFTGILDPAWPVIQARLKAEYARLAARTEKSRDKHEQETPERVLTDLMGKYRITDAAEILPATRRNDRPRTKQTTLTDSFTDTDATAWADHTGDDGWSWTIYSGGGVIESNTLNPTTYSGPDTAVAQYNLSSDDHYSEMVVSGSTTQSPGSLVRNDEADAFYMSRRDYTTGGYSLYKWISPSWTLLDYTTEAVSVPFTVRTVANGSTISGFGNTVEKTSVTDTGITGNVRCGLRLYIPNTAQRIDDFLAADISASDIIPRIMHHRRHQRMS